MTALPFTSIAIFGAGLSGIAAYKRAKALGINAIIADDKPIQNDAVAAADCRGLDDWKWDEIDYLVLSPGVPHSYPTPHTVVSTAKAHQTKIISEVEFALRIGQWGQMVVITGTNGKSTTTALTAHILKQAGLSVSVGGNLGMPLSLLNEQDQDGITVVELSSYQLDLTPSLAPAISVILNLSPDHLDRHGGFEGYKDAKLNAFRALDKSGLALMGDDSAAMVDIYHWAKQNCAGKSEQINQTSLAPCSLDNPYLKGAHNAQNAAFAVRIARAFNIDDALIETAINNFEGLAHRLRPVARDGKRLFVNDSKATNGDATSRALGAYDDIIWLAGGIAKEDGLTQCLDYLDHVKAAYFYGKSAADFSAQTHSLIKNSVHNTLDDAFDKAMAECPESAVILLSPAAASFDQYPNFGARGAHFETLVHHYINTQKQERSHAR